MSNIIQGLLWRIDFPNPLAKMVALKLGDNANDEGGDIYPAVGTIAKACGIVRSSVCKWQKAMEHCGLLVCVERSSGGARTDTTERAFDVDMLRRLHKPDRKTDPDLMLVVKDIDQQKTDRQGNPKIVKLTVFEVVPWVAEQAEVDEEPCPPVRDTDGSATRTRPPDGHHPSATRTGTRPPDGHEPFKENPLREPFNSPPTPARRGRERARDRQLEIEQTIAAIRSPGRERLVDGLFAPLLRRRTFQAPDPAFAIGQLCDWPKLARLDDQALGEVLDTLIAERASIVKDHDVQAAVERALPASDERRRAAEADEANRGAKPELRALWAEMLGWMRSLHGEAVVRSWLEPLRLIGTEPGPRGSQRLVLEARSGVLADLVTRQYAAHVEQAARACGAGEVQVEIRRPVTMGRAAA